MSSQNYFLIDLDRLIYHKSNGENIPVRQITIGHSLDNSLIIRVNGQTVPTEILNQLRELLYNTRSSHIELLDKVNLHKINCCHVPINY